MKKAISLNLLWKKNHTDRLLDYNSLHPTCHKKSVVKTLWSRATQNSSNQQNKILEENNLRKIFKDNNYPLREINKWIKPRTDTEVEIENQNFISIKPIDND